MFSRAFSLKVINAGDCVVNSSENIVRIDNMMVSRTFSFFFPMCHLRLITVNMWFKVIHHLPITREATSLAPIKKFDLYEIGDEVKLC